jgi:hypothetical protein
MSPHPFKKKKENRKKVILTIRGVGITFPPKKEKTVFLKKTFISMH